MCEKCQVNEATVHVTQILNGKVQKLNMCESCAKEQGVVVPDEPMNLGGMLEQLKEELSKAQSQKKRPAKEEVLCWSCGTSRSTVLKQVRMGCGHCYEVFAEELMPAILSLQKDPLHTGKVPKRVGAQLMNEAEMRKLREELEGAVAREEYERAAKLRDLLKQMEEKGELA